MAALVPTAAQAELISSFSQDEIPIKLRCAICSKLAVNAFRLPCCDQAICDSCQTSLPSSCPVCEHSPIAAQDCKPHKSLRTTIRVFLRSEEKKRDAQKQKDQTSTPAPSIVPLESTKPAPTPQVAETPGPEAIDEPIAEAQVDNTEGIASDAIGTADGVEAVSMEELQDVPQPSIEETAPDDEYVKEEDIAQSATDAIRKVRDEEGADNEGPEIEDGDDAEDSTQAEDAATGFGVDGTPAEFANMGMMGMPGDFNQMQMMMAMQNGMGTNPFGGFPMGMSMDPMAMQNMFMSGGFGAGMGMNGMNMGMGMGDFSGGMGAGFNNGWNGQQSWNIGQDNFNQPNATGMGQGDFGVNNSGFNRPNATGYSQGNYGRFNQYNDFQQNSYGQGFRGRGRGRGGYGYGQGRGGLMGYAQGQNEAFSGQQPQNFQNGQPAASETGGIESQVEAVGNVDEFGREIRASSQLIEDTKDVLETAGGKEALDTTNEGHDQAGERSAGEANIDSGGNQYNRVQSYDAQLDTGFPSGVSNNGFTPTYSNNWGNTMQMGYHGNQLAHQAHAAHVPDVPINAPKGPKAMRDGLPNTSMHFLRGRGGYNNMSRESPRTNGSQSEVVQVATERSQSPKVAGEDSKERSRGKNHSRSASRSGSPESKERRKERHRERRSQRHRSASLSDNGDEEERREKRRRHRSRRYEDDEASGAGEVETVSRGDGKQSRSRSPDDSRRSSQRSRKDRDSHRDRVRERDRSRGKERSRDRERGKDRDKDSEREHKSSSSSHKHRSSHRSHRARSRSPRRSSRSHRDQDNDRDRSRSRRRRRHGEESPERDHDTPKENSRSGDKNNQEAVDPRDGVEKAKFDLPLNIPKGPRAMSSNLLIPTGPSMGPGMGIKGASARGQCSKDSAAASRVERESKHVSTSRSSKAHEREHDGERSSRRDRNGNSGSAPAAKKVEVDAHTLEREKRNRERLLKEAQRIAGMAAVGGGSGSRKRSHADEADKDKGAAGKRPRRRGELDGSSGGAGEDRASRGGE